MNPVTIEFKDIREVKMSLNVDSETKELVAEIKVKVPTTPVQVARLLNLQKQRGYLDMVISSQQGVMDIGLQDFMEVDRQTGEIK